MRKIPPYPAPNLFPYPTVRPATAYTLGEELGWRRALSQRVGQARRFHAALGASVAVGSPSRCWACRRCGPLFVSGIVGGLGTPISLAFLLLIALDHRVMARHRIGPLLTTVGWGTAALVAAVSVYSLYQMIAG